MSVCTRASGHEQADRLVKMFNEGLPHVAVEYVGGIEDEITE